MAPGCETGKSAAGSLSSRRWLTKRTPGRRTGTLAPLLRPPFRPPFGPGQGPIANPGAVCLFGLRPSLPSFPSVPVSNNQKRRGLSHAYLRRCPGAFGRRAGLGSPFARSCKCIRTACWRLHRPAGSGSVATITGSVPAWLNTRPIAGGVIHGLRIPAWELK